MVEGVGNETLVKSPSKDDKRIHIVVKKTDYELFIEIQGQMIAAEKRNVYLAEVFHEMVTKWDSLIKSSIALEHLSAVE